MKFLKTSLLPPSPVDDTTCWLGLGIRQEYQFIPAHGTGQECCANRKSFITDTRIRSESPDNRNLKTADRQ